MEIDYFYAFIVGLLGSGHCMGMCGGITTMLTSTLPSEDKSKPFFILAYNIGRITSYSIIGGIAGLTGSLAVKNVGLPIISLKIVAGIFLILLGLYIGRWLMLLTNVELIGKKLWRYLQPLSKHLLPVKSIKQSMLLGGLWGWLPCGLVYSTLTWSLASGSMINGALIMLCFGLGTLPALLTMSFSVIKVQHLLNNQYVKKLVAILLIIYGIFTLTFAYKALF